MSVSIVQIIEFQIIVRIESVYTWFSLVFVPLRNLGNFTNCDLHNMIRKHCHILVNFIT